MGKKIFCPNQTQTMVCAGKYIALAKRNRLFLHTHMVLAVNSTVFEGENTIFASKRRVSTGQNIVIADKIIDFANNSSILCARQCSREQGTQKDGRVTEYVIGCTFVYYTMQGVSLYKAVSILFGLPN